MPKILKKSNQNIDKKDKPKRKLTEYNKFVRDEMKTFSSSVKASDRMTEIGKRWKKHKKR